MFNRNLSKHKEQQGRLYAEVDAGTPTRNLFEGIDLHTLLLTNPKYNELGFHHRSRESLPQFNNCSVRNHFIHNNKLYVYGVVTDDDLNAFVNSHANNIDARLILGLVLLDFQLENFSIDSGIDRYTEPIPFPAGNIAGFGAIEPGKQPTADYSVARVGNDLDENRKEKAGYCWEYEWVLEEHLPADDKTHPATTVTIPNAITRVNQLNVKVNFEGLKAGNTYYLSVFAKNLSVPFIRGISSPPFPIRIIE